MHSFPGFSLAIQQCLSFTGFWKSVKRFREWQGLIEDLLNIVRTVMDLARQVLGAKLHQGQGK